ncbi:N-acetylglucosaminyl-phosphatidylinositol de-n-acetylase [Babesia ovata]|uniref:N-acetylglucosaminylphosphatidylinositol deacetylase n=1 Tax=Babesia ovata TaxID=189622 RepID=A0A2H6K7A7_9APIC|nr:N-acetylglucosaminyl-phosphatidylinositol de-n-acetylase [Babesia ovata]XP_028865113.1 N-acetylglucosaminyl-phosphatidylinositol de-n-acetylase [Babesia ovata]GBE58867.1 N-acetylglucosaminyl-phosphatidylinositol de-n-acetylase [Babesia ovata]GBE58870.1 N-acetylglucosaminyl-phosphatidylinositol de-n-acetylase [Babesia ovata]
MPEKTTWGASCAAITVLILLVYYGTRFWLNRRNLHFVPELLDGYDIKNLPTVSFVFTHPNDEAYYFSPTLEILKDFRKARPDLDVHALVLSKGRYSGEEDNRVLEIQSICNKYNVQCTILDEPDMQVGQKMWDKDNVSALIQKFLNQNDSKVVITFDKDAVDGEPNHVSTYNAVAETKKQMPDLRIWTLRSYGFLTKFPLFAYLQAIFTSPIACVHTIGPAYQNVKIHKSEWSWTTSFGLFFSSYSYVNIYSRM